MKAKLCKVLSIVLTMVLVFSAIPARELAAAGNEDPEEVVQAEEPEKASDDEDEQVEETSCDDAVQVEDTLDETVVIDDSITVVESVDKENEGDPYYYFETQPTGGSIYPQSSLNVSWVTSFAPWKAEIGYMAGNDFVLVNTIERYYYNSYSDSYDQIYLTTEYSGDIPYSGAITSDHWVVRAFKYQEDAEPAAVSEEFSVTTVPTEFIKSPGFVQVDPNVGGTASWETNFKPWKVEVGYYIGSTFNLVSTVTKYTYNSYSCDYYQTAIPEEYSTSFLHDQTYSSDHYVLRAYYDESSTEPCAISEEFTVYREPLAFNIVPAGGTVEPLTPLNLEWETNFTPWEVEIGYYVGDDFVSVKTVQDLKFNSYTLDYDQKYLPKQYSTYLNYDEAVSSDRWVLKAYYDSNSGLHATSTEFSIIKEDMKFIQAPSEVLAVPGKLAEIEWETNFKPWEVEIGYYEDDTFVSVGLAQNLKYNQYTYSLDQYPLSTKESVSIQYDSTVTSDQWALRAYAGPDKTVPSAETFIYLKKAEYSGKCGNDLNWSFAEGVLTITGSGTMYNYNEEFRTCAPWTWLADEITEVNIQGGTTIGQYAFCNLTKLEKVNLHNKIKNIYKYAFKNCTSLSNVYGLTGVTSIGDYVFYGCKALKSISIPNSVTSLGQYAFAYSGVQSVTFGTGLSRISDSSFYGSDLRKVTIPSNITSIGDCAFGDCVMLSSVTIPDSVTVIENYAFSGCSLLTSVTVPSSVNVIGNEAFGDCESLTKVFFKGNAPTIGTDAFVNDQLTAYYVYGMNGWSSVITKQYGGTVTWVCQQKCGENLTWDLDSNGVLTISGTGAMYNYSTSNHPSWYALKDEIHTVRIMPGVTSIGSYAFYTCNLLDCIYFYGDAPSFTNRSFYDISADGYYPNGNSTWNNIEDVNCGGNINWSPSQGSCGENASWYIDYNDVLHITGYGPMDDYTTVARIPWYDQRDEIVGIEIDPGITTIGKYAFYGCSNLESVEIGLSVVSIGSKAFSHCPNLETVELPVGVETIDTYAFENCGSLTEMIIPDSVMSIGAYAFCDCTGLGEIFIPDSVESLGMNAFSGCSSLTSAYIGAGITVINSNTFLNCSSLENVSLPDGLTSIGNSAFKGCSSLTSIDMPSSVTRIYPYAFSGCVLLDRVDFPVSLTTIDSFAFSGCYTISMITFRGNLSQIGYGAFDGCNSLYDGYYYGSPDEWALINIEDDKMANAWFIRFVRDEGDCSGESSDVNWRLFWDGGLYIYGLGLMKSYSGETDSLAPWLVYADDISWVEISDGVQNIGSYAFRDCKNMNSVSMPDSLTVIEKYAFLNCKSIDKMWIPENVTSIQAYAFTNCENMGNFNIPYGVTEIAELTFSGCKSLREIIIPDSVTIIGKEAFRNCDALTEVEIPSGVTKIGNYAFESCDNLESVVLNEGLLTIGNDAFKECSSLKSITIPSTVTYIDRRAFFGCSVLKTVIFTGDAPVISSTRTFEGVSTFAYYPADNATWTEDVRQNYGGTIKWVALGEDDVIVKFAHSCSFGNDLSVNFYIPKDAVKDYENFRLVVRKQVFNTDGSSFTWKETTLTNWTESTQDGVVYLRFAYNGIAAKEMGDEINATLYMEKDGVTCSTTTDTYSIKDYAFNSLKYSGSSEFKTLLVDMLNYGAAAQTYFKYNTGHLVNAGLTDEQRAYASGQPELVSVEDSMPILSGDDPTAYFYGKSVVMGNNIEVKYYMKFDSGVPSDSVVFHYEYQSSVNGKWHKETISASDFVYEPKYNAYSVTISNISAKDMSCTITAAIYDGEYSEFNDDNRISEMVDYSIETYVYNRLQKSTDDNFKALALALIKYGKAAEQYFISLQ